MDAISHQKCPGIYLHPYKVQQVTQAVSVLVTVNVGAEIEAQPLIKQQFTIPPGFHLQTSSYSVLQHLHQLVVSITKSVNNLQLG